VPSPTIGEPCGETSTISTHLDTFPGEVLFELAVDALDMSGGQTNRVEKLVVDSRPGGP
jgi:hypothetical protein